MSDIVKCWWCKGAQLWVDQTSIIPPQHQVTCDGCDAYGPIADTLENAIAAWNTGPEPVAILRAILAADERGQGLPFAEAMDRAWKAVGPTPRKESKWPGL